MTIGYDAMVVSLERAGVPRDRAQAEARRQLGISIAAPDVDDAALEKTIEAACDRLMQELGFEVIRFSHPGKTKQTEGIADRRYYRRPRRIAVFGALFPIDETVYSPAIALWFEAKSGSGRQRPGQKLFEELVTACGEAYVCGTHDALIDWLVAQRIAQRVGDRLEAVS